MNFALFITPCAIILAGICLSFFRYSKYIPPDNVQSYVSHNGMNLSWIDLTEKQWAHWQKVLIKRYFLIFAGADFIINLLVLLFVVPFDTNFAIIVAICMALAALIMSVIRAEKYAA